MGCCAALVMLLAGLTFGYFHTHGEGLLVVEHNWSRKLYVEQFKTVREEATSVPQGGRQISSRLYVSGYAHIGKVSVPIYGTKYTYDIDKWVVSYYMPTMGDGTNPVWADASKLKTGAELGCERLGAREESYWLVLSGDQGKTWTHTLPETEWRAIADAEHLVGHVNDFGTIRWIDRAEAE